MQLSPFAAYNPGASVLQSLFGSPYQISCINTNFVTKVQPVIDAKVGKYILTKNSFAALATDNAEVMTTGAMTEATVGMKELIRKYPAEFLNQKDTKGAIDLEYWEHGMYKNLWGQLRSH